MFLAVNFLTPIQTFHVSA